MNNLGRSLLFALIGVVFMLPMASAGLVGVYLNDSEDLVTSEEDITLPYDKDFILTFHVGGPYRIESGDDNFSAYSINVDVHFLSDVDRRDTCTMCAIPNLKPLGDTDKDPGYDTYQATFFSDMVAFEGYSGNIQFSIIIKNRTSGIVWDDVFEVTIGPASSGDSGSSGFVIGDNPIVIAGGFLALIIFGVGVTKLMKKNEEELIVKQVLMEEQKKDMETRRKLREDQRKIDEKEELRKERAQRRKAMRKKASERERALDYDSAIGIWEELGQIDEAARVRKLKAEQNSITVDQTVIHGDYIDDRDTTYIDDRDTIVQDSVISKSNVGAGGKSKSEEIKEIKELLDSGAIDDDEFKQMKKEILEK